MDKEFRAFLESPDPKPERASSRRPKPSSDTPEPFEKPAPRRHPSLFGWTVGILLLSGAAMASWIGSFYVFTHPEDPRCYTILRALNKIDPPKRFEVTAAPPGKFFSARELYDIYLTITPGEIDRRNNQLLHDYLRNYHDTKTLVPYLTGRFTTLGVYELKGTDEFPSGVVAVAQSGDCPQVLIEHVYSTQPANIPKVRQMLAADPDIVLARKFDLSSVIHAEKREDGKVIFTVVPLGYGNYAFKQGISSTFRLEPPRGLNLEAGLPLVKSGAMEEAEKMFAQYRKSKGLMAKVKAPPLTDPPAPKKAEAYGWISVPSATLPMPSPADATKPVASQLPANAPVAGGEVPEEQPASSPQSVATETPGKKNQPVAMHESPAIDSAAPDQQVANNSQTSVETPVVQTQPTQPLPPQTTPSQTISPIPHSSTPAIARSSAPTPRTVTQEPPALLPSPSPAILPKSQKLIAKSTPPAPTPAAGRPIAHFTPNPSLEHIVSAVRTPAMPSKAPSPPTSHVIASQPVTRPMPTVPPATTFATPLPRQVAISPSGVKLEPFMASPAGQSRISEPSHMAATWRTYPPGQMPRGKLLDWELTQDLADTGVNHDRYYLRGKYLVTASSDSRIVLRPQGYSGETVSSVRVIVEFPAGAQMPQEGASVLRGESRPFQITDVRRGADGQLNVYAREVTSWPPPVTSTTELLDSYHSQRQKLANQYYIQQ